VVTFLQLVDTWLLVTRGHGGVPILASFLVVEPGFTSSTTCPGAAGRDLPADDPVPLGASILGYINALAAVVFLIWLRRQRRNLF
jgi:hypothetical protein